MLILVLGTRNGCCSLKIASRGHNIRMSLPRQNDLVTTTYYHVDTFTQVLYTSGSQERVRKRKWQWERYQALTPVRERLKRVGGSFLLETSSLTSHPELWAPEARVHKDAPLVARQRLNTRAQRLTGDRDEAQCGGSGLISVVTVTHVCVHHDAPYRDQIRLFPLLPSSRGKNRKCMLWISVTRILCLIFHILHAIHVTLLRKLRWLFSFFFLKANIQALYIYFFKEHL